MSDGTRALETDPSVCYRHPGRQSWVLCQRCGRTVCPECQILAPVGVHCPECVAETSGGVAWRPASTVTPIRPKQRRRSAGRVRSLLAGAGGGRTSTTAVSQGVLVAYATLFLVGLLTGNLPFQWLAGLPGSSWQLWRFFTAPQLERMLGVRRFVGVLAVSSVVGGSGMLLSGSPTFGLTAPLFGLFAALLVEVWADQRARTQILVITGINLLIALALGGLPAIVGGMIGGGGTLYLLNTGPGRGWQPRTPLLIIAGTCAALVGLTIVRGGVG